MTTIADGAVQVEGPHPIFGENVAVAEVQELMAQNFLPPDQMVIGFAPVIVNTGAEVVLFDTGNGAGRRPDAGRLAALLATAGFEPDQIDVVVLSHFHPDHIGGLMENGQPLLPNARYVTGEIEYDFWSPQERLSGPTERVATLVQANVVPVAEKITFIKEGAEVAPGIEALAAFGHTPGHMAFHLESAGRRLVITADTANHFVVSLQRPDWHVRFDMDKEQATASRKRIFDLIATERIPFSGYHMPFPAVGYVERRSRATATFRPRISWRVRPRPADGEGVAGAAAQLGVPGAATAGARVRTPACRSTSRSTAALTRRAHGASPACSARRAVAPASH